MTQTFASHAARSLGGSVHAAQFGMSGGGMPPAGGTSRARCGHLIAG